jgi:hypothetical protein
MRQAVRHCRGRARSEHANARQGSQADNNRLEIHVRLLQLGRAKKRLQLQEVSEVLKFNLD